MIKLYIRIYKNLVLLYKANGDRAAAYINILIKCLYNLGILPIYMCTIKNLAQGKQFAVRVLELIYYYLNERFSLTLSNSLESLNKKYYRKLIKVSLK